MDILEDYLWWRKYSYSRLDGKTAHKERSRLIDEFNAPGSDKFMFVLSTRAGGMGINLATADVVILYDSDWNPQLDEQAMGRAHRIGQTKQVRVFRFVTENTIEEGIVATAGAKLRLAKLVLQQGRLAGNKTIQMNKEEMLEIIRLGAEQILNADDGEDVEVDIGSLLAKSEKRTEEIEKKLEGMDEISIRQFRLGMVQSSSMYNFGGQDYKKKRKSDNALVPVKASKIMRLRSNSK